jgi:hypothetical protein
MPRIIAILLVAIAVTTGVALGSRLLSSDHISHQSPDLRVSQAVIPLLRSGYIVLRSGNGADSYLLSRMNQKDKTYSHCGIVMIEHGYPFVYHSIGGEDNPDERLRRDSAQYFFSTMHNKGFAVVQYDYDTATIENIRHIVSSYYSRRPRFDLKFDLQTDDKLYCSEFVYKVLNQAIPGYISPTTCLGRTFVGIDDLFMNRHAHMIWQMKLP